MKHCCNADCRDEMSNLTALWLYASLLHCTSILRSVFVVYEPMIVGNLLIDYMHSFFWIYMDIFCKVRWCNTYRSWKLVLKRDYFLCNLMLFICSFHSVNTSGKFVKRQQYKHGRGLLMGASVQFEETRFMFVISLTTLNRSFLLRFSLEDVSCLIQCP